MVKGDMRTDLDRIAERIQAQVDEEERKVFTAIVLEEARNPSNMAPMDDPDGDAQLTGSCGDSMRMFVRMDGDRVARVTFLTDGCGATTACGSMVTKMVKGMTRDETLAFGDEELLQRLGGLPEENLHCARLAVATLHKAVRTATEADGAPKKGPPRRQGG